MKKLFCGSIIMACCALAAGDNSVIQLPTPNLNAAVSLKTALEKRQTVRVFSDKKLSELEISNLLWSAYGANRPDGKRTVPAARGIYSVELYVAMSDGLYKHNHAEHSLQKISSADLRSASDGRKMGMSAPLVVVMVADREAFGEKGQIYTGVEAGAIMQNIYLYCAANNLNTVVCGSFDRVALTGALKLPANKYVILTQVIGCPNKN